MSKSPEAKRHAQIKAALACFELGVVCLGLAGYVLYSEAKGNHSDFIPLNWDLYFAVPGVVALVIGLYFLLRANSSNSSKPLHSNKSATFQNEDFYFPYKLTPSLLTPSELEFYCALTHVVDSQATICPKVRLGDLLHLPYVAGRQTVQNKTDRKHIDFVLCDPLTMRPLLAIELDGSSHNRPDRQERDTFVDQTLDIAGLPIVHIPVKEKYVSGDLAVKILPYLLE